MSWISKLLNNKPQEPNESEPSPSTGFHDLEAKPVPIALAASDKRAAREMVYKAAVHTAQVYGLPANWLSYEVLTIADAEKAYFQLQIVVHHWEEHLIAHTYAFERAFIKRLRDQDVRLSRAVRAVLWSVSATAGCPYDEMPKPSAWSFEAIKQRADTRDRINRQLYAMHTPDGRAPSSNTDSSQQSINSDMPQSSSMELGHQSTLPVKFHDSLADEGFMPTRQDKRPDYDSTQTYTRTAQKK